MTAAVRRHEQLEAENQATVSQSQQLRAQNASLADQLLSLSNQLNTEKVKYEQQLRAARTTSWRLAESSHHQEHLQHQVNLCLLPGHARSTPMLPIALALTWTAEPQQMSSWERHQVEASTL